MGREYFGKSNTVPIQEIVDHRLEKVGTELFVCRLDLYDANLSGNKFFKLKYNILEAKSRGCTQLISFGGAFSNHIHALALAGKHAGISTIGVIRGEENRAINDTLLDAVDAGMKLHFVSREEYRLRDNVSYQACLLRNYPNSYLIPEGGGNVLGVKGCTEIVSLIERSMEKDFDTVALSCGTASTMAGIVAAMQEDKEVLGISVLKGATYLEANVKSCLEELAVMIPAVSSKKDFANWHIDFENHCGGYAKLTAELAHFMADFQVRHGIPVEPVYTGKLFLALFKLVQRGKLSNRRIVAIHTGGLQGLRGMKLQIEKKLAASPVSAKGIDLSFN